MEFCVLDQMRNFQFSTKPTNISGRYFTLISYTLKRFTKFTYSKFASFVPQISGYPANELLATSLPSTFSRDEQGTLYTPSCYLETLGWALYLDGAAWAWQGRSGFPTPSPSGSWLFTNLISKSFLIFFSLCLCFGFDLT